MLVLNNVQFRISFHDLVRVLFDDVRREIVCVAFEIRELFECSRAFTLQKLTGWLYG